MLTREAIIKKYTDFFTAGAKSRNEFKYGLEAEHFVIDKDSKKAIPYFGENGVLRLMNDLKSHFCKEYWVDGHLLGHICDEAEISLEPGSQLEISINASADIKKMASIYEKFHQRITTILDERNQQLITIGYQPASLVRDIELLPKLRYSFMDEFFRHTGDCGINMMRGTASCQVILDYFDELDFIVKYQSACILTPLFALISSNTPIFEGQPNENPLIRTHIWRGVDPARCGIPPMTFDPDFSFKKCAEYIIDQDAIFENIDNIPRKSDRKVHEILAEKADWDEDFILYLSLLFPDVRLRQYIEIRVADSMPYEKMFAYMALIKGLFLDMPALTEWLKKFPRSIEAIVKAEDIIMEKGLGAIVYGEPVTDLLKQMLELSRRNLGKQEAEILETGFGNIS